jgi:hypothetical protein
VQVLYLVQNKISAIEAGELNWCKDTLTSIELGGNRIRVSYYPRFVRGLMEDNRELGSIDTFD